MAEQQGGGGQMQLPGAPNYVPGLPANFDLIVFEGFEGLNTKATRPAIGHQECSYLDNIQPLGKNNARGMYDVAPPIFTAQTGLSISNFAFANVADTAFAMVVQSDGSIVQVITSSGGVTTMAGISTIAVPTNAIGFSQWGSQYAIIVAPQTNGYFLWDTTNFYTAGTLGPTATILYDGSAYTGVPTITPYGGSGSGATIVATFKNSVVDTVKITNPGSGYGIFDVVACSFSGGQATGASTGIFASQLNSTGGLSTQINSITLVALDSSGHMTSAGVVLNGGSGYSAINAPVQVLGGGGFGGKVFVSTINGSTNGQIGVLGKTSGGQSFTSNPTLLPTDGNNQVAQAYIQCMPGGIQGTCVEVFTSRVWVGNGDAPSTPPPKSQISFSAPGSFVDFATSDGGGTFTSNDSFLKVGYHALKQSNGFLYLIGDSSVNYITPPTTSGLPPSTIFQNQNVDPQIGSPWPNTVQVYSRAVTLANPFGIHALYGGAVQKVSTPLDGIYTSIGSAGSGPTVNGISPSSAVAVINGIHVYITLMPIIDPLTGNARNALLCWDGTRWWTASQSVNINRIATQEINSIMTCWGTDGHALYQMFQVPSQAITKTIQSKLWDTPTYIMDKKAINIYGLYKSSSTANITVNFDNDIQNTASSYVQASVSSAGIQNILGTYQANGLLMGLTLQTTAEDFTLISLAMGIAQEKISI